MEFKVQLKRFAVDVIFLTKSSYLRDGSSDVAKGVTCRSCTANPFRSCHSTAPAQGNPDDAIAHNSYKTFTLYSLS